MRISDISFDLDKAVNGVVYDKEPLSDGAWIRVAHASNKEHMSLLRKISKSKKLDELKTQKETERALLGAFASKVFLAFGGFTDAEGEFTGELGAEIPDTFENRLKILTDEKYRPLADLISKLSQNDKLFTPEINIEASGELSKEDLGNLFGSYNGTGNGQTTKRPYKRKSQTEKQYQSH